MIIKTIQRPNGRRIEISDRLTGDKQSSVFTVSFFNESGRPYLHVDETTYAKALKTAGIEESSPLVAK